MLPLTRHRQIDIFNVPTFRVKLIAHTAVELSHRVIVSEYGALNQFEPVTPSREEGMTGLYYFAIAYSALDVLQATCRRLLRPASIIDDVVDHGEPIGIYARSRPENGGELTETWWFADGALQLGHRPITVDHRRGLADQLSN